MKRSLKIGKITDFSQKKITDLACGDTLISSDCHVCQYANASDLVWGMRDRESDIPSSQIYHGAIRK